MSPKSTMERRWQPYVTWRVRNGYSLIEVGNSGINAFFVRKDLLTIDDLELAPETSFREKSFPDGARPSQQWKKIRDLEYVDVTKIPVTGQ